jgi:hypothetical protein
VNTVQGVGLEQGVQNFVPDLIARYRFFRFEGTREYDKELEEARARQDLRQLSWEDFKAHARKLREKFREREVTARGADRFTSWKAGPAFADAYETWLREQVARELFEPDRAKLIREKEEELVNALGEEWVADEKKRSDYLPRLERRIVDGLVANLADDKRTTYAARYEAAKIRELGEQAVTALAGTEEWEQAFTAYYKGQRGGGLHDYPYEEFLALERAPSKEAFLAVLGDESAQKFGEEALREKVRKDTLATFATEARTQLEEAKIFDRINEIITAIASQLFVWLQSAVSHTFTFLFHLILSIFLSFIIVIDIRRLERGVALLEHSRVQRLYREIVPGLASFGNLMGKAFQAQALIAVVNTGLTMLALVALGVGNRAFLCSIVFVSSFIPVAGSFISTVPIALVALQMEGGGIMLALKLIGMILTIHFLEGMVFNPKILGDMLHLHPLLVLIILTVGGHFFGVWGLLLGVPVCVYVIRNLILRGVDPRVMARLAPKVALAEATAGGPVPPAHGGAARSASARDRGGVEDELAEVEAVAHEDGPRGTDRS